MLVSTAREGRAGTERGLPSRVPAVSLRLKRRDPPGEWSRSGADRPTAFQPEAAARLMDRDGRLASNRTSAPHSRRSGWPGLHDSAASHYTRDIGAYARRASVILMRAGEIEGVIAEPATVHHPVLRGREPGRVGSIVGALLAQALRTEIDRHADGEDGVDCAEIDRDPGCEPMQGTQPARLGKVEGIIALVGCREEDFIE